MRVNWVDRLLFYPPYWFRRAFRCFFGKHRWHVFYITDGCTSVWCSDCKAEREPTVEEAASHPNVGLTPEQLARKQEQIDRAMQWLKDNGYSD